MSDGSPSRSAVIEMKDERRAMHEGYVFLDEKCLLLAGEILRELAQHGRLRREFDVLVEVGEAALQAAVGRHGLHGLQVHPGDDLQAVRVASQGSSLMGVKLQASVLQGERAPAPTAVWPSPEARACRQAHAAVLAAAAPLAAVSGNLERLSHEYRRALRRARALQDVMLPELDRQLYESENRLEELEQEDAIWMRQGAAR